MNKKKTPDFEESMQRLEEIAEILESGETSLEESLKLYEESASLAAFCTKALSEAELKIKMIEPEVNGE